VTRQYASSGIGFLVALAIASAAAEETGLPQKPTLSLAAAKRAADACEALATQNGWRVNIAIVDDGAHLVLFRHMNGSPLISRRIAIQKAESSALIPRSTRALGERAYGGAGKAPASPGLAALDGVILFAGGLPIKAGDTPVGGIGISGVTADQDEQCAQAGIDAISDLLK